MEPMNGSGVEYPKVELGGVTYEVKFTRGLIYRIDQAGISFTPRFSDQGKQVQLSFSNLINVLRMAISFPGTAEELAELAYDKRNEITTALVNGWGNLLLSVKSAGGGSAARGGSVPADAVRQDEEWLRSWAYATSPYGLALKQQGRCWALTPREFQALADMPRGQAARVGSGAAAQLL